MTQTTFDLSTLSDITDGAHTVKVKAKANGYIDSEFSNEVSYTKAPAEYTATFSSDFNVTGDGYLKGIDYVSGGETKRITINNDNYASLRGTSFSATQISNISANAEFAKININGAYYYNSMYSPQLPYTLNSDVTISEINSRY